MTSVGIPISGVIVSGGNGVGVLAGGGMCAGGGAAPTGGFRTGAGGFRTGAGG